MGRQHVGLRKRDAVHGWDDDRGRQRREGQVGGAEALAIEVRATVGEQLATKSSSRQTAGLVLDLDPRADAERVPDEAQCERPAERIARSSQRGTPWLLKREHEFALGAAYGCT